MAEQAWWFLVVLLPTVMAGAGFVFGYDTNDTREDNLVMFFAFVLLSVLATCWVYDPLFPELDTWLAIIIAPSWVSYLLWWAVLGHQVRSRRTKLTYEI